MTDAPRFDETQVAEILTRATQEDSKPNLPARRPSEGVTLEELKEIGAEVGIAPERIEQAAAGLLFPEVAQVPDTFWGLPERVLHIVEIPRPLDEGEWARLVSMARETFGALGELQGQGHLQSWHNGNLQMVMEPSPQGEYRIRMQTKKSDAKGNTISGFLSIVASILFVLFLTASGKGEPFLYVLMSALGVFGAGVLVGQRFTLPRWAEERQRQMQGLGEQVKLLAAGSESGES